MTQTEALRLALEALEPEPYLATWYIQKFVVPSAITAIKASLANEALERKAENARELGLDYEPLEAKDEPVAWRDAAIRLGEELSSVGPDGYYDMDAKKWLDWAMKQNPWGKHSLPQRTWVGLTDEDEIDWEEGGNLKDLVKAIEAKLKELNT